MGALLLVLVGALLHARVLVLRTDLAAPSAPRIDLQAPAAGRLEFADLQTGAVIQPGAVLATVENPELAGRLEVARATLALYEENRRGLNEQLGERTTFFNE